MRPISAVLGAWAVGAATGSANAAFTALIPPNTQSRDPNGGPFIYPVGGAISGAQNPNLSSLVKRAGWFGTVGEPSAGVIHVTDLVYTTGNTANAICLMQPLNWTYT